MGRNVLIQVKVSPEEKRTIQKLAERHAVYPSQLLRAIGLRSQLGDDQLQAILEEDRAIRMSHAVGEAKAGKPVEEFPVESPGTIDETMAAERKRIEDDLAAKDIFLCKRILELKVRMSSRNAEAQARREWDER